MTVNKTSNFNLHINPYDGEAETINLFEKQILDLAKSSKWTEQQTATFIKSKLTSAALKYVCANSTLLNSEDPKYILTQLKDFFGNSASASFSNNPISMLPGESIKNLAHRINVHIQNTYPTITDVNSINQIKMVEFLNKIPISMKIDILKSNISDYPNAVKRATLLQNIELQQNILNTTLPNTEVLNLNAQLNAISQQITNFTQQKPTTDTTHQFNHTNDSQLPSTSNSTCCFHNQNNSVQYSDNFYKRSNNVRNNRGHTSNLHPISRQNFKPQKRIVCQICEKTGHTAKQCFKYRGNTRNQNPRFRHHRGNQSFTLQNSNVSGSQLNPNARPYDSLNS